MAQDDVIHQTANSVRRKPELFISSFKEGGLNVIQSFTLKQVKPTAKWVIIFLIIQWHYKYYIPYYSHKIYKMVSLVAQINYIAHHIYTNKKTSERHKRRSILMTSKAEITLLLLHYKAMLYGKSEGVLFSETVKSSIPSMSFDEKTKISWSSKNKR